MFWKRSGRFTGLIDPQGSQRILMIKLTSLGDVIHALPVASRLKTSFPRIKLFWVVEDRCAPILEAHPLLEGVVVYPRKKIQALLARKSWDEAWRELVRLRRALRDLRIDLSIDLQGLAKSGLMALLAGAPRRLGCTGLKEFSYWVSRQIPEGEGLHAVDRNLKVAEFLGCPPGPPDFQLGLRSEERTWADHFLQTQGVREGEQIIGLQVGASLPQKCWPLNTMGRSAGAPFPFGRGSGGPAGGRAGSAAVSGSSPDFRPGSHRRLGPALPAALGGSVGKMPAGSGVRHRTPPFGGGLRCTGGGDLRT